jgi:hypothetical protein
MCYRIPIERALELANKERITEHLYPLFVRDIEAVYRSSQPEPLEKLTPDASGLNLLPSQAPGPAPVIMCTVTFQTDKHYAFSREITAAQTSDVAKSSSSILKSQTKEDESPELLAVSEIRSPQFDSPPDPIENDTSILTDWTIAGNHADKSRDLQEHSNSTPNMTESGSEFSEDTESSSVSSTIKFGVPCASLAVRKTALIDAVMDQFMTFFANCYRSPRIYLAANADALDDGQNESSKNAFQPSSGNSKSSSHSGKGKRKLENDDNNEDGEQDENDEPFHKRHRGASPRAEELEQNFACPYFKRNRRKYQRFRSCPGPGWSTVHRMK